MTEENIMKNIYMAIWKALESRLHLIGSVIEGDTRKKILEQNIRDKGDFYQNTGYDISKRETGIILTVGSNVPHEPFVLGGKVPSWTPLEPLKGWIERKRLSWTDKKGDRLSIEKMAYMIRSKIKREGIPARNVFAEVIKNKESWIYAQLNSIEMVL